MSCFDNLIGISDVCDAVTPSSGLTLKSIGITVDEANNYINSDYESGVDLLNEKIDLAVKIVSDRVSNHLSDKIRKSTIIESQRLGFYKDNMTLINGEAGKLKGIRVELRNDSSFLDVYVSELSIQADYTGDVPVFVYDLIQNKLVDTLTVASVAGEVSNLIVNKTYKSSRKKLDLIFVYDSTSVNSYKSTIKSSGCLDCGGLGYHININSYIKSGGIKIASSDTKILSNTTSISDTGGLSINYSVQCNTTDWLCTFSNQMALSIAFKTAYLVMEYALHNSNRQNSATLIDEERTEKRMAFYDFEYQKSKGNLLKNIKTPTDAICFQCKSNSRHGFAM